jgi:hypothetical protein
VKVARPTRIALTIDRTHGASISRPKSRDKDADNRSDDSDRRNDEWVNQTCITKCSLAENECGNKSHCIRLEEVRSHSSTVTNVVTDVVGNRCGVTRIILGDSLFDLTYKVSTNVSCLSEDSATDAHEHRKHRGSESEALKDGWGIRLVEDDDDGSA